ncbi:alginate O-acetyltransferase AlgF [Undibacterium sp. CY18W]|uniref:Alginate biosynthesis protein AlgF n=1 Tax=Undibacterium hunanense TaxID=2762292 RepID=A0ABR6ZYQ4_9BURK|nr:alginate O-acetyltransferase AlgF [Undibacterium hunanense]MBC3920995.1 alginate O-acetyltransferase AlgF [Undibacterium hunanense]
MPMTATAQSTGALYEPEPPADASYIRVIYLGQQDQVDVLIDGKIRQTSLQESQFSHYMVLPAGPHELILQSRTGSKKAQTLKLDVRAKRIQTLAFMHLQAQTTTLTPVIFEDRSNSNRLKSTLTAYHLAPESGTVNIKTADGKTSVFRDLAPSTSYSLAVNPVSVELLVCPLNERPATSVDCAPSGKGQARTPLAMERGDNYSLLLSTEAHSDLRARVSKNTLEPGFSR